MKCPRCGADNADRAERCYLCEYPFTASSDAGEPPAPEERLQPRYPAPPPGVYAPGFQPPPPAPKGPMTVKIIIGVLVLLLIVILGVGAFFYLKGKTYSIEFPPPPGFSEAEEELVEELKETMEEGDDDIVVDKLLIDAGMSNFVIAVHSDIPVSPAVDTPSGDDPEEMEEWFYDNEDEWVESFNTGIIEGAGVPSEIDLYQVERLATGDAVLHMVTSLDMMGTPFTVEVLWVIKGRTAFAVILEGLSIENDTVEFLKENIAFAE